MGEDEWRKSGRVGEAKGCDTEEVGKKTRGKRRNEKKRVLEKGKMWEGGR